MSECKPLAFTHGNYVPHKTFYDIYHGCMLVNEDGTRTLICKNIGERCPYATSNTFSKLPEDVGSRVETRMMEMRKKKQRVKDVLKINQTMTIK